METYIPLIQATLADWLLLTLGNPWYAGAIAIAAFLLTATLYSIKVASLKNKNTAAENAYIGLETRLNAELNSAQQVVQDAQQQIQKMQEELAAISLAMQKDQQLAQNEAERAAKLEAQLGSRNQQIADIIQSLHTSFDLGERPLPLMGDSKAEGLWQQHERVIALLATRLRGEQKAKVDIQAAHQSEIQKRAEQEALLATLQTSLAHATDQLAQMELALDAQTSVLQQQQNQAQQVLSQTLEKHQAELARFAELEEQTLELVNARLLLSQLDTALTAKDTLITQLEKEKDKLATQVKAMPQPAAIKPQEKGLAIGLAAVTETAAAFVTDNEEPAINPVKGQTAGIAEKLKGLLGKAKSGPSPVEPEAVAAYEEVVMPQAVPELIEEEPSPPVKGQAVGLAGKLKSLLGKPKQVPSPEGPEVVSPIGTIADMQPPLVAEERPFAGPAKNPFGKLKNLLVAKPTAAAAQAEEPVFVEEEPVVASPAQSPFGKLKNLLGPKPTVEEIQPEGPPVSLEEPTTNTAQSTFGKFKSLLGKAN